MQLKIIIPKPFIDEADNRHETMLETAENYYFPLDAADYIVEIPLPLEQPFSIKFIENRSIVRGYRISAEIEADPLASLMIDNLLDD